MKKFGFYFIDIIYDSVNGKSVVRYFLFCAKNYIQVDKNRKSLSRAQTKKLLPTKKSHQFPLPQSLRN